MTMSKRYMLKLLYFCVSNSARAHRCENLPGREIKFNSQGTCSVVAFYFINQINIYIFFFLVHIHIMKEHAFSRSIIKPSSSTEKTLLFVRCRSRNCSRVMIIPPA
ncbi:hypothetical protein PUN28_016418 [Cardiocondyla obscurior]|uniref:Secreted protein n=1 Tax=Cardiocondyla obscurior TaxID=286306 RepID=A0AAW2ESF8_9HYME